MVLEAATVLAQLSDILPRLGELPPLHPILVNFTAALIPASFASDVAGRLLGRESLRAAAWWMLVYAAVVTPLTAAAGWYWLWDLGEMDHAEMRVHQWLGTGLAVGLLLLTGWRGLMYRRSHWPTASYLAAAGVFVGLLIVQGHLGGVMSFGTGGAEPALPHVDQSPGHSHGPVDSGLQTDDRAEPQGQAEASAHPGVSEAPAGPVWRDYIGVGD